jgi:glycosyltransferase involved in cell wall biosynthesis
LISFVIPAHNEEGLLGQTLMALHAAAGAAGEPYEIVVADDASTDGTALVAAAHGARVVAAGRRQIAATRNRGAAEARGDLLVFVDADTVVNEAVVRAAIGACLAGAVGGGCAFRFEGPLPRYARILQPIFVRLMRIGRLAGGCFIFCTRPAFDAVGGFDERLFGAEEAVMSRALRRQGRFVVLREGVVTSGRKLRVYSPWEIFRVLGSIALRPSRLQSRDGLDIWYGERRPDPQA